MKRLSSRLRKRLGTKEVENPRQYLGTSFNLSKEHRFQHGKKPVHFAPSGKATKIAGPVGKGWHEQRTEAHHPLPMTAALGALESSPVSETREAAARLRQRLAGLRGSRAKTVPEKKRVLAQAAQVVRELEELGKRELGPGFAVARTLRSVSEDGLGTKRFADGSTALAFLQEEGFLPHDYEVAKTSQKPPAFELRTPKGSYEISDKELSELNPRLLSDAVARARFFSLLAFRGRFTKAITKSKTREQAVHHVSIDTGHMENYDFNRFVVPGIFAGAIGKKPSYVVSRVNNLPPARGQKYAPGIISSKTSIASRFLGDFLERQGIRPATKKEGISLPESAVREIIQSPEQRREALGILLSTASGADYNAQGQHTRISFDVPKTASWVVEALKAEGIKASNAQNRKTKYRFVIGNRAEIEKLLKVARPESSYFVARAALAMAKIQAPPNYDECLTLLRKNREKVPDWMQAHVKRVLPHMWA